MVDKQTNQKRKKTPAAIDGRNQTCLKAGDPTPRRPDPETLSAIKEGRSIAADVARPAYKTMEELKAALEK